MPNQDFQSAMEKLFVFQEKEYNYCILKSFNKVKTYTESSHFDRKLVADTENDRFFLYEFYEYEDFSRGNDEIYETFVLVKDEAEADALNEKSDIKSGNSYIFVGPGFSVKVSKPF